MCGVMGASSSVKVSATVRHWAASSSPRRSVHTSSTSFKASMSAATAVLKRKSCTSPVTLRTVLCTVRWRRRASAWAPPSPLAPRRRSRPRRPRLGVELGNPERERPRSG